METHSSIIEKHVINPDSLYRLELYSSAYTLSDMEIFVFPELLFGLVLANIMSEKLWQWRDDPWFANILKIPPKQRVNRIKQYIMDHYTFNLDLDTWGLTTKESEVDRFEKFIDIEKLKASNALFGYEGDKYYFSIDIRRHFGLDKYKSNIIPYWKTETLEAMDAFNIRPDWSTGGGECVSLSTLYAAALFVVGRIPLNQIYLMATPLHSQNYISIGEGILTNNRRIVTKKMLFNGTELSSKARRALENERVTIVSHCGRHIHYLYDRMTMDGTEFSAFSGMVRNYLKMKFDTEIFGNFIRSHPVFPECLCYRYVNNGREYYIECEKVLRYESDSKLKISDKSRRKLLASIDLDEFYPEKIAGRLVVNDLESFIRDNRIDLDSEEDVKKLTQAFCGDCKKTCDIVESLKEFAHIDPRLPVTDSKTLEDVPLIDPAPELSREELMTYLRDLRSRSLVADLAFYAYRAPNLDMAPFWKASLERNPVCIEQTKGMDIGKVHDILREFGEESIYPENRVALPDEVWNFMSGDGFEKAVALLNILTAGKESGAVSLEVSGSRVLVKAGNREFEFFSKKEVGDLRYSRDR